MSSQPSIMGHRQTTKSLARSTNMGFRFQKRIRIFKGLTLNLSKSGTSWTVGRRGASVNLTDGKATGNVGLWRLTDEETICRDTGPSFCSSRSLKRRKKVAEKECQDFVREQIRYVLETNVFDVYSKKGSVVVEVGYKEAGNHRVDSYSVRLCVLDKEKGTISLPSPLNDSEWKK